jgi:glycerol-3-phosphate dehydrogenase subunit B
VAVPRVDRSGWDADSLAACWSDDAFARRHKIRFVALDAALLRYIGEDRIADADLAERYDDPSRLAWLAARLREAFARTGLEPGAVILGPWLGLNRGGAEALSGLVGVPAGEALAGTGSPTGLRFARARDRLLKGAAVTVQRHRVTELCADDEGEGRWSVTLDESDGPLRFDRVVLACGGLIGGGIVYDPLESHTGTDMPEKNRPSFRLSFAIGGALPEDGRLFFAAGGARLGVTSSMYGLDLDQAAWPSAGSPGLLESVGLHCDEAGNATPDIAAAGDVIADRPRTLLAAVRSGLQAGARAAR